ncbi:MAG: putative ABC exporter domain-containing protein, partial [Oscillibacter sp.]|nr:putative ABC exporter domain-containing protein [Oscillibacter sp.]
MRALFYLRGRKLKNQLKSIVQKPTRLLYTLFLLAILGLTLFNGARLGALPGRVVRSVDELNAAASALYLVMFVLAVAGGFSRGGSLFSMPDVNLLFPAPIRPQRILFHGLLQQMAASLFVGFFLIFQYPNLRQLYGIHLLQLLLLLVGYAASVFLGQVTAMLIYSLTNGDEGRKRIGGVIFYGVIGAFAAYVLVFSLRDGRAGLLPNAVAAANSPVFRCLPVVGWLNLAMAGALTVNPILGLLGTLACAAYLLLLVFLIFRVDPDYYEDVLASAELLHSAITAKKEGVAMEAAPRNVRLGKTGFNRGWGSSAFYYKHLTENRRARKFLLSTNALIFAVTVIGFAYFLRDGGLFPVFLMATYLQLFASFSSRLNLELARPHIYLVPEPPMKKLLWCLAELLPSAALEAAVIFLPVGAILALPARTILVCILARLSYTLLFTASNLAVERLWGGLTSRALILFLLLAVAVLLAAPGLIAATVLTLGGGFGDTDAFLCTAAGCNLLMS